MTDKPAKRQRRQHLKNVRQVSKQGRIITRRQPNAQAATISGGNILVSLGLVVTSVIMLLFLASVVMQYVGNSTGSSDDPAPAASADNAAAIPLVERSTVEVRVLNGCGIPGVSRQMTNRLRDLGFDVVIADNADNFDYANTLVVDHTDRPEVGQTVARALGCSQLSAMHDEMALAHVTVILGRDWASFLEQTDSLAAGKPGLMNRLNGKVKHLLED